MGTIDSMVKIKDKLISVEMAASIAKEYRDSGKKVVFTNGCFDILHVGHVTYLQEAKAQGDILIVGVNADLSVTKLKGDNRPINPLEDRMYVLAGLMSTNYIISFEEETPIQLIEAIHPDVLIKGGDYTIEEIVGADVVQANGGVVKVIDFVEGKSTSKIISKMKEES